MNEDAKWLQKITKYENDAEAILNIKAPNIFFLKHQGSMVMPNQPFYYIQINANKIIDGLFIGNQEAAQEYDFISSIKCNHIINCAGHSVPNMFVRMGIRYLTLRWLDCKNQVLFDNNMKNFRQIMKFIEPVINKGQAVLIHSRHGNSRAVCVIVVYLIHKYGWDVTKCIEFIRFKRPEIAPKPYFVKQLKKFAKKLKIKEEQDSTIEKRWLNQCKSLKETLVRNTFLNGHYIFPPPKELQAQAEISEETLVQNKLFKLRFSENLTSSDSQKNILIDDNQKIINPTSILKKTPKLEEEPDYMYGTLRSEQREDENNSSSNNNLKCNSSTEEEFSMRQQQLGSPNKKPILLPSSTIAQNQLSPLGNYLIPEYLQKNDNNAANLHPASVPIGYNRLDPQQNQQLLQILHQQQNYGGNPAESCFSSITSASPREFEESQPFSYKPTNTNSQNNFQSYLDANRGSGICSGQENNIHNNHQRQQLQQNNNISYCQQSEAWCHSENGYMSKNEEFGENQRMLLMNSGKNTHVKELSVIGARSSGMSNHHAWGSASTNSSLEFPSSVENSTSSPIPGGRNGNRSPSRSNHHRRNTSAGGRNRSSTTSRKKRRKKKNNLNNNQRMNQSNFKNINSSSSSSKNFSSGRNKNFPYNKNSQKKTLKTTIRLKPENKDKNSSPLFHHSLHFQKKNNSIPSYGSSKNNTKKRKKKGSSMKKKGGSMSCKNSGGLSRAQSADDLLMRMKKLKIHNNKNKNHLLKNRGSTASGKNGRMSHQRRPQSALSSELKKRQRKLVDPGIMVFGKMM